MKQRGLLPRGDAKGDGGFPHERLPNPKGGVNDDGFLKAGLRQLNTVSVCIVLDREHF